MEDYFGNTSGYNEDKMRVFGCIGEQFAKRTTSPVDIERGQVLDIPILTKSPWVYELEVQRSLELEGSEVFFCKVRNVLAEEAIFDEPKNIEEWMNAIKPIQSVRTSYFKWDSTIVGSFGEPMKKILKNMNESEKKP